MIDLRDSVTARDRELAGVREQLDSSRTRIGQLESSVAGDGPGHGSDELVELRRVLDEREASITDLEAAVAERDEALSRLHEATGEHDERTKRLEAAIAERDGALANWQRAEQEQQERTRALEDELAGRDAQLASRAEELAGRDARLASQAEELAGLWGELERATRPTGAEGEVPTPEVIPDGALERLRTELSQRDRELSALRAALDAARSHAGTNGASGRPEVDDLREITGLGPKMARTLAELGVDSYRELALLTDARVAQLVQRAPQIAGRLERDGWIDQARVLFESKYGVPVDAA